jgi:hypothetical protein
MLSITLVCGQCNWRTVCGEAELVRRLRAIGAFRRASHPPEELVAEVLRSRVDELPCDHCRQTGLRMSATAAEDASDDGWGQVVTCEICRVPIPAERLAAFPSARRCRACQDAADRNALPAVAEYCPKCGAILELRVSHAGGITRYKQCCTGNPPCRL